MMDTSWSFHSRLPSARFQVSLCSAIHSLPQAGIAHDLRQLALLQHGHEPPRLDLVVVQLAHRELVVGPLADLWVLDVRTRGGVSTDRHPRRVDVDGGKCLQTGDACHDQQQQPAAAAATTTQRQKSLSTTTNDNNNNKTTSSLSLSPSSSAAATTSTTKIITVHAPSERASSAPLAHLPLLI